MPLDQATQAFLGQMTAAGGAPLHERSPDEARALGAQFAQLSGPGPAVEEVTEHELPATGGGTFLVRVLTPSSAPVATIVYFHGGGWVTGHIDEFDHLARRIAGRADATVVLVNYRKAPEHAFPAAVEDAWQSVCWAVDELGASGRPLIVAGDSAGGTLATVVARRAREAGGPEIALQVLVYPVCDADFSTPSYVDPANQLLLNRPGMMWYFDHYVPTERRGHPDISPLRADLHGLAPALVVLAEHDVLRSEGEAYAEAMRAAGVDVELVVVPGQMHGFFSMVGLLPGHETALDLITKRIAAMSAPASRTQHERSRPVSPDGEEN